MIYIALLWVTICLLIWVTRQLDRVSALLLLPYLAWVSFASILNFAFWSLVPERIRHPCDADQKLRFEIGHTTR